jgi:cytoskeletal protein RodZ
LSRACIAPGKDYGNNCRAGFERPKFDDDDDENEDENEDDFQCRPTGFSAVANRFRHCQAPAAPANNSGMATVAEQLRTAREARNLSIPEVAEITKIRTDHLRALEEGNFDLFVAPVYIRGFVRTYATLLKLEVPHVMRALEAELGATEKFSEPPALSREDKGALNFVTLQLSKLNSRTGGIILAILLVLAVGWLIVKVTQNRQQSDPARNLPPARVQTPPRDSGQTLPLPTPAPTQPRR